MLDQWTRNVRMRMRMRTRLTHTVTEGRKTKVVVSEVDLWSWLSLSDCVVIELCWEGTWDSNKLVFSEPRLSE
jgi:hypothetical protein